MKSTRRAALQAGAAIAAGDVWALRHAWGTVGERAAVTLAVAALIVGAAAALAPWLHALVAHKRGWAVAAALVAAPVIGWPLAATASAQRLLGAAAPLALAAASAAALLAIGLGARVAMARDARSSVPLGRWAAALVGTAALAMQVALPSRLYPSVRVALLVGGFVALTAALRRAGSRERATTDATPAIDATTATHATTPADGRALAATLALAALLLVAGRLLVGLDANIRFVAHAQAPAAGFVLDALPSLRGAETVADADEPPARAEAPRPEALTVDVPGDAHLVIVTVDALRADRLRPDLMPQLTALAARGLRATHAYATAPSTAASITSLLTAQLPTHFDDRPPSLAERLRAAGWYTACFYPAGLFFDGGGPLRRYADAYFGFRWADTRTLPAAALTDAVLDHAREVVARGEPRSLLWLHYFDPHEPYTPSYDDEVRAVDAGIGRLAAGLAMLQRPVVLVVTADHGEEFGEHGGAYHGSSLYDEQLRVPLVIVRLDRVQPARVVDAPLSLVDVVPALLGEPAAHEVLASLDSRRMIVRGDWKLVRDLRRDVDALYDLASDPGERRNLADARSDVAETLRAALETSFGHAAPQALAATVADASAPAAARADAARQLGVRESYAAAEALRAALGDGDAVVRAEAALALAQLSDRRAQPALRALLDDPRWGDRAAVMLGRLRDAAAARRLTTICRRPLPTGDSAEAAFRREAAHYLGFLGGPDAVDALVHAAEDPRVRGSAYIAIGRIAGRMRDTRAAQLLRARVAVEDRPDARKDLATALDLAAATTASPN